MRIPLDYYRILGLPIQTGVEQMQQAYRDRILQLPRREYSEAAIAARKQLIEEAYAILSDAEQRSRYDASYFAHAYEQELDQPGDFPAEKHSIPDSHTPSIDIADDLLVGALLILQELGEYELVFNLGGSYLSNADANYNSSSNVQNNQATSQDIVLTVALACLELGREKWQRRHYEDASNSLEIGHTILSREGLFPGILNEIQVEINKLRPYRILELLAQAEDSPQRHLGLQLLQDILQQRGGIDGTGDDGSGLSLDNFLRFIQQLRSYMTATEQKDLFVEESQRPCAVATYLAAYALLAQGFTQRQPALIRQAKLLMVRLGKRQDLYLEQAICSLLLGQTEAASSALELSQEHQPLAFIREHSLGSPDLLPGLCLYSERWLQSEVFPHFRDLINFQASLKNYFADEQVQNYLETLPSHVEETQELSMVPHQSYAYVSPENSLHSMRDVSDFQESVNKNKQELRSKNQARANSSKPKALAAQKVAQEAKQRSLVSEPASSSQNATNTLNATSTSSTTQYTNVASTTATQHKTSTATLLSEVQAAPQSTRKRKSNNFINASSIVEAGKRIFHHQGNSSSATFRTFPRAKKVKLALLLGGGILGIAILGQVLGWLRQSPSPSASVPSPSAPPLLYEPLGVQLNQPPLPIPSDKSKQLAANQPITKEVAQNIIQSWLSAKSAAFGQKYDVNGLQKFLAPPALSRWQKLVQTDKAINQYRQYKHSLKLESVTTSKSSPHRAAAVATVYEAAQIYRNGRLIKNSSYNEKVRVKYDLVRKDGSWRIREMQVLK